jgi:DNA-binding NtrC family response regulator
MGASRILLVDDEAGARHALARVLEQAGHEVVLAGDAFEASKLIEELDPDLTVSDLMMPGMSGLQLLKSVREGDPDAQLILVSALGDIETAVEAMREGAFYFLSKPIDVDRLLMLVDEAIRIRQLRRQATSQPPPAATRRLIGESAELQRVLRTVAQVGPSNATVLITGESGTGKELVAEAVHQASSRSTGPMVRVNCAALADSLLESELFGHERGAFTGADRTRKGRLEQANGGTLFLDEIGEISHAAQVKLLRFLQERVFERVGGNEPIRVDVRIVAATNRRLRERVAAGAFREDLYYRLNVVTVHLPPLRERPTDIPALAMSFLERYAVANHRPARRIDDGALAQLVAYGWPGNVRELQNVMERAVVLANGEVLEKQHLSLSNGIEPISLGPRVPGASLAELERHAILTTLQANGGSTMKAASTLGISVRKIQYRLLEYAKAPRTGVSPVRGSAA